MGDKEINAVAEVIRSGWIGLGHLTKEFESKFANYIGVNHAVALNSATSGLHLAMKVMDVEGFEVITTPMTFISCNQAILYNNAIPVFCDIEPDTLNIDAEKIESLITDKTKAILVVHYGGYACNMGKIMDIAKKHKLKVIEDCSHSTGGYYKNHKLGSIGDVGVFSFHAVKNMSTGDGGMITINNHSIYNRLLKLRWCGIDKDTFDRNEDNNYSWYYDISELGYKYHTNDIASAIGIVQLAKVDNMNMIRETIVDVYNRHLVDATCVIETPIRKSYQFPAFHNYVIKCDDRDSLIEFLKSKGISCGVHYIPSNHYDLFKGYNGETPISDSVWKKLVTLPLFPDLSLSDVFYIIENLMSFKK